VSSEKRRKWIARFAEAFAEFFDDWLPSNIRAKDILEQTKIPQIDYFGFWRTPCSRGWNREPMTRRAWGFVYNKVAHLLQENLPTLKEVFGLENAPKPRL